MPLLTNVKHERFAQELAKGLTIDAAYVKAGYKSHRANAARLRAKEDVKARVAELMEIGARQAGVTVEMVVTELAKIGFGDIRRAVRWGDALAVADADGNQRIVAGVALLPSDEVDDATAASIAEIAQTRDGLRVKFHDKRAALVDLGKHLGMFVERRELSGPGGAPIPVEDVPNAKLARAMAAFIARIEAEGLAEEPPK